MCLKKMKENKNYFRRWVVLKKFINLNGLVFNNFIFFDVFKIERDVLNRYMYLVFKILINFSIIVIYFWNKIYF